MADDISDEAFARALEQMGAVSFEQLEAARARQAEKSKLGAPVSLSDVLVEQGLLAPAMRDNIVKKLRADQQTGGLKQLGPYKLLKKLGEGGMGAVYLADDTSVGRKVAVKVLPQKYSEEREFLTRFRREAQATGRLNHANIVTAYNVGDDAGTHYYAMEYCEGETLDRILKREEYLPWDKAVAVVIQVARGLKHAHDNGVIHRDIKPANIFICKPFGSAGVSPARTEAGGTPALPDAISRANDVTLALPPAPHDDPLAEGFVAKILDLGLSKSIGGNEQSYLTQTGAVLGTPHYLSPEQASGDKGIDGRTDIYSLGATLYHLVTGQTPFQGSTAALIMMKHLNEQLPNPQDLRDDIPDGIVQLIQKMMAKKAGDRYANCEELLADLELASQGKQPAGVNLDPALTSIATRRKGAQAKRRTGFQPVQPVQPVEKKARPGAAVVRKKAEPVPLEPVAQASGLRRNPEDCATPKDAARGVGRPSGSPGEPAARPTTKYIAVGVAGLGLLVLIAGLAMRGKSETPGSKPEASANPESAQPDTGAAKVEPVVAKAEALPKEISLDLGGGVKMDMVLVPAGEFMMGSDDADAKPQEMPPHKVKISQPFYIGKYDVTVAQFRAFAQATKFQTEAEKCNSGATIKNGRWQEAAGINWQNTGFKQGDDYPACVISWNDAQAFCKWASGVAQLAKFGNAVRLPSEAEWEYAARGPKSPQYPWGDKWEGILANVADASLRRQGYNMQYGEIKEDDGYPFTSPGGAYKNASWCGAYDMAGNVWQWCQDYFNDKYYGESPAVDPQGPANGAGRVRRGGCFGDGPGNCRSAHRLGCTPAFRSVNYGFRVVMEAPAAVAVQPEAPNPRPEIAALPKEMSLDLGGGVKMDMVLVPAGEFMMGSEEAGNEEEKPVHKVRISKPYYIGKYDVTVAQFRAFAEATKHQTEAEKRGQGYTFKDGKFQSLPGVNWQDPGFKQANDHPVAAVTWSDAQEFAKWATKLAGRTVRLPTEAEWEYAARGPNSLRYPWGDKWEGVVANAADASLRRLGYNGMQGAIQGDDGYPFTSPGGAYKNASWCGAFDMAGNVWQWCQDYYSHGHYTDLREIDPTGPAAGPERVSRGGSWAAGPAYCRSARRSWGDPSFALADHGFRVVVEAIPVVAPVAVQPAIAALPKELALDLGGGVKMDMLLVPAGEFVMGSNDGPPEEKPVHNVKVSKPFYIGKYHVTVAQFRAFADGTKYRTEAEKCGKGQTWKDGGWKEVAGVNWQTPGFPQEDNFPACVITWNDAQEFCKWATERTAGVSPALEKAGGTPAVRKWTVCLPTEAQWEYACRAGTTTRYNSGDKDSDLEQEGWFNNNSGRHTNACGLKKPNAWGLYDMHGNVWQWVQDFFNDKYYTESPLLDPKGPANGAERVLRGGAWDDRPDNCRASRRHRDIPGGRYTSRGFRLALDF